MRHKNLESQSRQFFDEFLFTVDLFDLIHLQLIAVGQSFLQAFDLLQFLVKEGTYVEQRDRANSYLVNLPNLLILFEIASEHFLDAARLRYAWCLMRGRLDGR